MSDNGPSDNLAEAVKLALRELGPGPSLGAFGIARDDCALVHIDYFSGVHSAQHLLCDALAGVLHRNPADVYAEFCPEPHPCDCRACVGPEKAAEAKARYRAGYTKVKEWHA